ncbi:MAG TPA: CDGSH iron-sulfur domain-containing protein [Haliangium sp.]|nr:CDGSH iron-sulfur domain-containing protein [Haliangium sp.]
MANVTIQISKNGPLLIKDEVKVVDMATGNEVKIEKFPIALCRCGQSATKPFCDGAHSRCGFDGSLG